jgi:hypothetical protein
MMARWSVDLIRKRVTRLGTLAAAKEAEAIKKRWRFFVALGHAFQVTCRFCRRLWQFSLSWAC